MKTIAMMLMSLVLAVTLVVPSQAQLMPAVDNSPTIVSVDLIADKSAFTPGAVVNVAARFKIEEHWHIYYKEPGETGRATTVDLKLPDGFVAGEAIWQEPKTYNDFGYSARGYEDEMVIIFPVTVPASLTPGETVKIEADVTWLACETTCIPGSTTISLELPVVADASLALDTNEDVFVSNDESPGSSVFDQDFTLETTDDSLWGYVKILFFALVGGFILNFMPCVLPVISLKIMSFVKEAGESRAKIFRMGLAYALGTVSTCLTLALLVITLQLAGYSVGWGFQFQQPLFLVGMATLVAVMSLGMFDVFMFNPPQGETLGKLSEKKGMTGAFFTGVVATILATPCSAPFLGTAIGFAFAQPWWGILAIFAAIGTGLASPYVVLSMNPAWTKFIPKPGNWLNHFKQVMGFVLLMSAVWLLHVLSKQVGSAGVVGTLTFIVATSFCAWLIGTFAGFTATRSRKIVVWIIAAVISATSFYYFTLDPVVNPPVKEDASVSTVAGNGINWQPFSTALVDKHLNDGKVVFLDFTAEWCTTCKVNEHGTLASDVIADKFKQADVQAIKADWTQNDPVITEVLRKFGKSGVPVYVVMSPHRPNQPVILPEFLNEQMVVDAIDAALTK